MQFTVNGLFEPVLKVKPGQTEIWVLANVSDIAYMNVELTETATGYHPKIAIVGQDGIAYGEVHYPYEQDGTQLLIPPASRFAIAVTMPAKGSLRLSLPGLGSGARTLSAPGVLYTNNGTPNPPAQLGTLSILPSAISYADGFFIFPSQTLLDANPDDGQGVTTAFNSGQKLDAPTPFHDLSKLKPDVSRTLLINGGFLNNHASNSDPKAFVYAFDGNAFPNVPLIQARLGSVEEWNFVNHNNDAHPIHVHVNDFQVTKYFDPTTGTKLGPQMFGEDNANVPAPLMGPQEAVIQPGTLTMRTRFNDYLGLYVLHCHRLNHEDNGLMMLINVIPAISDYAVAVPGSPGHPATVNVFDGHGDRLIATVTPFPDFYGTPSVAIGDVDADGVYDLIVGAGKGHSPEVVAYSGAPSGGKPFSTELARFQAFDAAQTGGVSVASTQIDGRSADNIIVGSGAGTTDRVRIFSSELPAVGTAPATFATLRTVRKRCVWRQPRRRIRRLLDRTQQHRDRSRNGRAGQSVFVLADDADRCSAGVAEQSGKRAYGRVVCAVWRELSRSDLDRYRMAGRFVRRRRSDRRQSALGCGNREGVLDRNGAPGQSNDVLAQRDDARNGLQLQRDRVVQAVRRRIGRSRCDDVDHDRCRFARKRRSRRQSANREVPPHALEPASAVSHRDARARDLVGNGNGSGGARRRLGSQQRGGRRCDVAALRARAA